MRPIALVLVILGVPTASISFASVSSTDSTGGLALTISTPKTNYVIGEPVKVDAVLVNESGRTIWICDIDCSIPFDLHVTCPTGGAEKVYACGVVESHCGTVPLAPGSGTYEAVYPRMPSNVASGSRPCAFAIPGEQRIRLIYRSPSESNKYVGDAELVSNELILQVVTPDSIEREILGALNARGVKTWCMDLYAHKDGASLHRVIALYPEHPATNYVRLQLARYIGEEAPEEALRILLDLVERDPEFWFEEVRIQLAQKMRYVGRTVDAPPYLLEVFRRRPLIITNPAWGWEFAMDSGGVPAVREYRERRKRGEVQPEPYLAADSLRSQ